MIQKKICMVGVFGTGKTCLVQQFVHSRFSVKYHSTVGVKIDRKVVPVEEGEVTLLLWDLAGRDGHGDITVSYLRGAHGVLYVVDGTRRETFEQIFELREIVEKAVGPLPSIVALNKSDLTEAWKLGKSDEQSLTANSGHHFTTSAKTGAGVEAAFAWIAREAARQGSAPS
jgi:small GTP-binding protein